MVDLNNLITYRATPLPQMISKMTLARFHFTRLRLTQLNNLPTVFRTHRLWRRLWLHSSTKAERFCMLQQLTIDHRCSFANRWWIEREIMMNRKWQIILGLLETILSWTKFHEKLRN